MSALPYNQALREVHARVKAARTSFAMGMSILPRERRDAMYALYAFCREVDDIADDAPTEEKRKMGLGLWRERISNLFGHGIMEEAITTALAPAIRNYGLVEADFQAIIDGVAMDAGAPIAAPDEATLDLYCDRVASAVGRVSVRIFGASGPEGQEVAYHLGRAFQLTNILRDVAEDAERGRLYLPKERLEAHGAPIGDLQALLLSPQLPAVCRDLAKTAAQRFADADAAMALCPRVAMRPARVMRTYYGAIYDRLIEEDWKNPMMRVSLPAWQKLWLFLRTLMG
jgi:phytoene synthase